MATKWYVTANGSIAKTTGLSSYIMDIGGLGNGGAYDIASVLNERYGTSFNNAQWNKILSDGNWDNLRASFLGNKTYIVDEDELLADLQETQQMFDDYAALGDQPLYETYLEDARKAIDAENAEMYADLDNLLNAQTDLYNEQMANISSGYDTLRSNLLSQQYQQNAQLMDMLQSGMERSRRNALEAGASAGIRIADNINTLLSVQNKQSASSMETANQLSQMMINQRNAEYSARSAYNNVLAQDTANRHSIKLGSENRATSLAGTNYDAANDAYTAKQTKLDNQYGLDNPFYEYRHQGSKYSTNTN